MATPSIPKESDSVLISREEFERLELAQSGIGSLLWIIHHGSFDGVGSIVPDLESLMKPHHSELAELAEQLQGRFDKAEKGPEKEPEAGPDYFSRNKE